MNFRSIVCLKIVYVGTFYLIIMPLKSLLLENGDIYVQL
jgi:hypothetical protein